MEESETAKNTLLNVEYIQEKLGEGYVYTKEAKGRDLVLVIGNTGVGKSTTCNYLLGHKMKENKFKGRTVIETIGETNINIGHAVKAETLYAKTILVDGVTSLNKEASNSNICLLDCPGFLGNRTIEERVVESISTELAIRNAHQIKSILILISLNILQETRVTELRELVKTLISLFKDPVEMVQYSIIIITKKYKFMPNDEAREITTGALSSLKDHCKSQAKVLHENRKLSSSEGLTYMDYDRIATYFSAVLDRQNDIVFINPLDNGESRKLVFDRINGIKPRKGYLKDFASAGFSFAKKAMKKMAGVETNDQQICPITIDDFNFSAYDENRVKFNKAMYDIAHDGHNLIGKIKSKWEKHANLCLEIANDQARLSTQKQLLSNLGEEVRKIDEDGSRHFKEGFESIKNLESMIIDNDENIKHYKNEIDRKTILQEKLKNELGSVNTEEQLVFMKKSIYKNVSWWKAFGWEEMEFSANTGDSSVQIMRVDKEKENGTWIDEIDKRNTGFYQITYHSDYHSRPARASVTTFIQAKDEAGNKIRIKEINNEIAELNTKQEELNSQIENIVSKNKTLRSTIDQAKSNKQDYIKSLKQKLKECENDIERRNCQIGNMHKEKEEANISGLASLQEFFWNQQRYDILDCIAALLEFPSSIVQKFISEYKKFLSDVENNSFNFDENISLDSLPLRKEAKETVDLKDPITGDKIEDLVVTSAGTLFDVNSLLKQFSASKEPFLFQRKDGSVEEIKYFDWTTIPDIQSFLDSERNQNCSRNLSSSASFLTQNDIVQMTSDQLVEQEGVLLQEIQEMKEQLVAKRTELEKICRRLVDLRPGVKDGV